MGSGEELEFAVQASGCEAKNSTHKAVSSVHSQDP